MDKSELKIETFRTSPFVNVVDNGIRIIHLPTGVVVISKMDIPRMTNYRKAMKELESILLGGLIAENKPKV